MGRPRSAAAEGGTAGEGHVPKGLVPLALDRRRQGRPGGRSARLEADLVRWALQRTLRGQAPTERELEEERQRRQSELVEAVSSGDREDEGERPEEGGAKQEGGGQASPWPARPGGGRTTGLLSRRQLLRWGGAAMALTGVQAVTALGVAKAAAPDSSASSSIPAPVLAAGGTNVVDGSDDPDPTRINQVALAAINGGRSLYAPFHGATANPMPGHLERLFPPPPQPAQPGRLREFSLTVRDVVLEIAREVRWAGWTFNGTIPGPVIRVTQGDHVRIVLTNTTEHPHSLHLHGIHPANQDGVFQIVPPGGQGTYEFTAEPFGVFPYHCHVDPLDQHTARGLYGVMIIDPPSPRPPATEMVMLLNGYDVNFDRNNELYSVNGMPGYYYEHPIQLQVGRLNRIYVVNMTEFDAVNSFHLHANMFAYYPAGTSLQPSFVTDVVHLGVADRGIIEFTYEFPGQYLFHAHQNELTIHGWVGLFNVV